MRQTERAPAPDARVQCRQHARQHFTRSAVKQHRVKIVFCGENLFCIATAVGLDDDIERGGEFAVQVRTGMFDEETRSDAFERSICSESGLTLKDARNEVKRALNVLKVCAEEALQIRGETLPLDVVEGDLHPRSVCGWIVNPMDCSALARELGAMALVVRPDGTRWPLRFWDPRVTSHLARVLMRDQYAAMRPFLENWRSLDHEGRLVQAAVPALTNAVGRLPLRFDSMQWRALQRVEHVNAVLHMAPESDASQRQVNAKRADEAMQRAERRGYSSDADLRIFAVCALMAHARFDEHPRVDEAIRLAQQNGLSVAAAIDGFDDEFWASLNDGRWLEHHR